MTKFLSFFDILILEKESETISVDDVADIFKMYGVDYKEVRIKYVLEVIIKCHISNKFWKSLLFFAVNGERYG